MKKLVDYSQAELEADLQEVKEWRWVSFIAIITVFGLSFWISELIYQRDSAKQEALNYKAIAEKQTEYYQTKLDTMVFYNECGVRIELKENE
jgi:hypothetical protein